MRICAYNLPKRLSERLKSAFGPDLKVKTAELTPGNADPDAEILVISITSAAGKESLSRMSRLKGVVTASTGTDHIDLDECRARGIEVRNCPGYSSNAVAELAVALAFAGLRDLGRMLGFGRSLAYPPNCFYYIGSELSGKHCAVLGTGQIGSLIAKKLLALGCKVTAYSRRQDQELAAAGVEYKTMEEALAGSDMVFLALPSTPQTYHVIGSKELSLLRDGAAIVNIARGELIDSAALLSHIGRLSFVATDVIEGEAALWLGRPMKVPAVAELASKPNFLLVPHIGASTREAQARLAEEVVGIVSSMVR